MLSHSVHTTRQMLRDLYDEGFPIQVRHGTPKPQNVFRRRVEVGLDAIEGGPVSYCLPYGRTPLADSIEAWAEACQVLSGSAEYGRCAYALP
jgi:methylaspartate mutase epsilon subunit